MKKLIIFLFLIMLVSACAKKEEKANMDQLASDGQYHYSNEELGFSLVLPAEFEYYQTQRNNKGEYIDMQFFVPTADKSYPQEIQSYAEAAVVRIYEASAWEATDKKEYIESTFNLKKEGNGKVYFMKVWPVWPSDWQEKWTEEKNAKLLEQFNVLVAE